MVNTTPKQNKALVLEAFDTLFNRRDYAAAERFWFDRYIQHSAHIAPGRVRAYPRCAGDTSLREPIDRRRGDYVVIHGRVLRQWSSGCLDRRRHRTHRSGKLAEHRDVLQDEATKADSINGLPMFGDRFPS
jgi:predicted SnoaL-like aldol condensation-catalyzing enzyme